MKEETRRAAPAEFMALQDGFTPGDWLIEPGGLRASCGDGQLREAILAWRPVFGDSSRRPGDVAANGPDGYSIIARIVPKMREPMPERLMTVGLRRSGASGPRQSIVSLANRLLAGLRRRRVFQVSTYYLVSMWLLLQVGEVTFVSLHFPSWWVTALATTRHGVCAC